MSANTRYWVTALAAAGALAFVSLSHASDANGEVEPSILDQHPDCMNRGQVPQGQSAPCELQAPLSGRRPRAALGSASTVEKEVPGSGSVNLRTDTPATPSGSVSANTTQANSRVRSLR
ncbi:MAG TPA: hypothetical protein VH105_12765 [Burkholderiales bacterium]|nr:hypothetical protein [Burkholderiales bacterium]